MIIRLLKKGLSWALFVVAAAFFWGTAEAVLNYFWPATGTRWGEHIWESAFRRSVFYAAVVAAAVILGLAAAGIIGLIWGRRAGPSARTWPGRAALAGALASNLGWFVAGLSRKSVLVLGRWSLDLREPGPFVEYWIFFIVLGAAFAVLLARPAGRPWWRRAARWTTVSGAAAFALLGAAHVATQALRPKPDRPNIVLIYMDAWRADAFRADLMPSLYAYANENATVYRRVWSCASWTYPSMASAFTGRYPDEAVGRRYLPKQLYRTAAQTLYDAGYDTAAFVGNPILDYYVPLTAGFDTFFYFDWKKPLYAVRFYDTNWYCPVIRAALSPPRYYPPTTAIITRLATEYLSKPRRRPFFLWVHYMDPHGPYEPPPGYYRSEDEKYMIDHRAELKERSAIYHRLYEGECAYLDDSLPELLHRIGAFKNTAVVITSDHGEEFWEHETYDHGQSVCENVVRVPLIISVPGVPPAVSDRPVSLIDLAPTVLYLAGLEVPAVMRGEPLIGPAAREAGGSLFVGSDYTRRKGYNAKREDAVVCWPWKLILPHRDMRRKGKYYDLAADPGESTPLPEDAGARILRKKLRTWKRAVKAENASSSLDTVDTGALRALGYVR